MVSGQLWKLDGQTLINKAKLWQSNDAWRFSFQGDDRRLRNVFTHFNIQKDSNEVLGALIDGKVKEQKLSSTESRGLQQKWREGEGDNEGFFTLINSASNKILTAKSDNSLHVKHNIETKYLSRELNQAVNPNFQQIIFDQLGENVRQHPSLEKTIEIHVPIHDDEPLIIHMDTSKDLPSFQFLG